MVIKWGFVFPSFRLDTLHEGLWRGSETVPLRRKLLALLHYLVEHPGRLVTREELFAAVWPDTHVSEGVLTVCIRELRQALEDDSQQPRFIETIPRRGYRFIGKIRSQLSGVSSQQLAATSQHLATRLVGQEAELGQLHGWLEKALQGERQVVFVTGEPGIGKTSLVEVFLERAATEGGLWIGRGQCIEHYSASEAYLPVLEALGRLCRELDGERLIAILRQHAPLWLAQLPSVVATPEREALQR